MYEPMPRQASACHFYPPGQRDYCSRQGLPIYKEMPRSNENPPSLLVFHSSGLGCALPVEAVLEIVPIAQLSTPPGLPSMLAGFLDRRGTAIPIVLLDRLFNLPEQPRGLNTPFIILRGAGSPVGFLVGAVRQIVSTTAASFLPLPEKHLFHDCATATVEVDGEAFYLLSPERILLEHERRLLAEFQTVAQDRLRLLEAGN
jgi:purine-binding chemotaxis protein CheW